MVARQRRFKSSPTKLAERAAPKGVTTLTILTEATCCSPGPSNTQSFGETQDPAEICTLRGSELDERLSWIGGEILPYVIRSTRMSQGMDVDFREEPGLKDKLNELIRLEAECCEGILYRQTAGPQPGVLRLEIRGIDSNARVFQAVWEPLGGVSGAGTLGRLVKSIGAGTGLSLLVCCVLPIAAVAVLGGVAAPLSGLDGPIPITIGAVVGGALAWRWSGRPTR